MTFSRSEDSNKRPPGTPGTPGSRDLEAALRRLSLRRDNYLSEKRFFEDERERKLAYLEKGGGEGSSGPGTPTESLFSLCTHPSFGSVWSGYSFTARSYLPEKLQIVKPLEGEYHTQSNSVFNVEPGDKENQNPNNRYLILGNESNIFVKTSEFPKTLWRTSSLLEMQSLTRSQPQLRAPLALVTGLLEVSAQP